MSTVYRLMSLLLPVMTITNYCEMFQMKIVKPIIRKYMRNRFRYTDQVSVHHEFLSGYTKSDTGGPDLAHRGTH
jgi:predicted ATPase with chaperone activity